MTPNDLTEMPVIGNAVVTSFCAMKFVAVVGLGIGMAGPMIIASGLLHDRPPLPIWKAVGYSLAWIVLVYCEYRTVQIFADMLGGDAEPNSVHAASAFGNPHRQ